MYSTSQNKPIAVFGASGHTARFVLDELERRGMRAVLVGRNAEKLAAAGARHHADAVRVAHAGDPVSLDDALCGAAAVINCAGPFLDTALPVVDAALRVRIPYLDVTAEQAAVQAIHGRDADARRAGVTLLPAAAFYGGLADLLASSLVEDSTRVEEIAVAVALDSWHPTEGTRVTGARNTARRLVVRDGVLRPVEDVPARRSWTFRAPFGRQEMVMLPFSETLTLSHHLRAGTIESWINVGALRDVRDPATPPPEPVDERGRSSQRFVMDVLVRTHSRTRRAVAFGRDIYAVSAPIVVDAAQRVLAAGRDGFPGARSLGEIFDARAFLETLSHTDGLQVQYDAA